jgi:hypothetical protein
MQITSVGKQECLKIFGLGTVERRIAEKLRDLYRWCNHEGYGGLDMQLHSGRKCMRNFLGETFCIVAIWKAIEG